MNLDRVTTGRDVPNDVNVIIEIPMLAAPIKYEVDKDSGAVFVDRFLSTAMFYPCNYGYVPQTLSGVGDPVDVLVLSTGRDARPDLPLLRTLQGSGSGQVGQGVRMGGRRGREEGDSGRRGALQKGAQEAEILNAEKTARAH